MPGIHKYLTEKKYNIAFIFLTALFLRCLWVFIFAENVPNALGGVNWDLNPKLGPLPPGGLVSPDFNQVYDPNARMLAEGKGFSDINGNPTAYVGPGYSFFISLIYKLFGVKIEFIRLAQILIDSLSCLILMILVHVLTDREKYTFFVGLIYAFFPFFIYQTGLLISETLFLFLLLIYFLVYSFARSSSNLSFYFLSGLFLGMSCLTRPNALILFCIFPLILFFLENHKRKQYLLSSSLVLLGSLIIIFPWILRNYILFNQFIPISSVVFNTVEDTTGAATGFMDLILKKISYTFSNPEYLINHYFTGIFKIWYSTGSKSFDTYIALISYPMILLSFYGLIRGKYKNNIDKLFIFFSGLIFTIGLLFFAKNLLLRYVVPIFPLIILFSSIAICELTQKKSVK
tara:strand:- start:12457 stop:13662 length:1206 start_codon:yes stop_codon:yes gene_type:complete